MRHFMNDIIEEKRDKLNFELLRLLTIISMIDGLDYKYDNYKKDSLSEEEFLNQQLILARDATIRLLDVFKD